MSYCRWSSCNGYCDVYVYADVHGGWTTHVAARRHPPGAPDDGLSVFIDPEWKGQDNEAIAAEYRRRRDVWAAWTEENEPVQIDHPLAGTSHNHETPGDCAGFLQLLKDGGFQVPQYAIDALLAEEAEDEACEDRQVQPRSA